MYSVRKENWLFQSNNKNLEYKTRWKYKIISNNVIFLKTTDKYLHLIQINIHWKIPIIVKITINTIPDSSAFHYSPPPSFLIRKETKIHQTKNSMKNHSTNSPNTQTKKEHHTSRYSNLTLECTPNFRLSPLSRDIQITSTAYKRPLFGNLRVINSARVSRAWMHSAVREMITAPPPRSNGKYTLSRIYRAHSRRYVLRDAFA